ncbi:MAG: hypothetical protein KF749_03630 [Bacteroidetes bacterium]|nr:hypothetical protein [Bacteroidota bacterium]MCW5897543.1 hypothetical protein [Bacteroidota bacterium]
MQRSPAAVGQAALHLRPITHPRVDEPDTSRYEPDTNQYRTRYEPEAAGDTPIAYAMERTELNLKSG